MLFFRKKKIPDTKQTTGFSEKKPLVDEKVRFDFGNIIRPEFNVAANSTRYVLESEKGDKIGARYVKKPLTGDLQVDATRMKELMNIVGNNVEEDLRRYLFEALPREIGSYFEVNMKETDIKRLASIKITQKTIETLNMALDGELELRPGILPYFYYCLKDEAYAELRDYVNGYVNSLVREPAAQNMDDWKIVLVDSMIRRENDSEREAFGKIIRFYLTYESSRIIDIKQRIEYDKNLEKNIVNSLNSLYSQLPEFKRRTKCAYLALGIGAGRWTMVPMDPKPVIAQEFHGMYEVLPPLGKKEYTTTMNISGGEPSAGNSKGPESTDVKEAGGKTDAPAKPEIKFTKFGERSGTKPLDDV